jgi:uncharacterized membrane protein
MKKLILAAFITTALAFAVALPAAAQEKKEEKKKADPNAERTIRGTGTCAKCDLGEGDKCQNVIQVTRKDKEGKETKSTIYLADNQVSKDFHATICKAAKPVVAVGKVAREGGKQILTATKIEVSEGKKK